MPHGPQPSGGGALARDPALAALLPSKKKPGSLMVNELGTLKGSDEAWPILGRLPTLPAAAYAH